MNKKSIFGLGALISLFSIPFSYAALDGPFRLLEEMGRSITWIGSLSWITDKVPATKFAIFVVLLTVIYFVLHTGLIKTKDDGFKGIIKDKKAASIIAIALASIGTIFMPDPVVSELGNMYSVVAVILLGIIPSFVVLLMAYKLTAEKKADGSDAMGKGMKPWARHGIRFLAVLMATMMMSAIAQQYGVYALFFAIPTSLFTPNISKTKLSELGRGRR